MFSNVFGSVTDHMYCRSQVGLRAVNYVVWNQCDLNFEKLLSEIERRFDTVYLGLRHKCPWILVQMYENNKRCMKQWKCEQACSNGNR